MLAFCTSVDYRLLKSRSTMLCLIAFVALASGIGCNVFMPKFMERRSERFFDDSSMKSGALPPQPHGFIPTQTRM